MESTNATLQPRDRLIPNPKLRLRAQVAEVCRFRHMSLRTEDTYWQWIRRYVLYHGKRPRELVRALDLTKPAHPPRVGTLLPIGQTRSVAAIGDTEIQFGPP